MDDIEKFVKEYGYDEYEYLGSYKNNKVYILKYAPNGKIHCGLIEYLFINSKNEKKVITDIRMEITNYFFKPLDD